MKNAADCISKEFPHEPHQGVTQHGHGGSTRVNKTKNKFLLLYSDDTSSLFAFPSQINGIYVEISCPCTERRVKRFLLSPDSITAEYYLWL